MSAVGENSKSLAFTRVFDAPRELVWRVWTDPDHALRWIGPRDYPAVSWTADARVGGAWRGCLRSLDGKQEIWQGGVFREIREPELIIYTFQWDGGPETLVTIRFEAVGEKTRLHFHQTPFDSVANREGHRGGWSSSFDRFEDLLNELRRG